MKLERIISLDAAFDKRHPDPSKNYGVHGVTLRMTIKGELGATGFVLYTNWQLPHVQEEGDKRGLYEHRCHAAVTQDDIPVGIEGDAEFVIHAVKEPQFLHLTCHPLPADLGYHSPKPMFEDQPQREHCTYLDGPCYYDGSALRAQDVYKTLLTEGDEGVWKILELEYKMLFMNEGDSEALCL